MPVIRLVPARGESIVVEAEDALIGREPSCHMVFVDSSVSRQHAIMRRRGDRFSVEDQGSANGTFVNSRRISGEAALKAGDTLTFGSVGYAVEVLSDAELASLDPDEAISGRTLFASSQESFSQTMLPPRAQQASAAPSSASKAPRSSPRPSKSTDVGPTAVIPLSSIPKFSWPPPESAPPPPSSPKPRTAEAAPAASPLQPTRPMSADQIAAVASKPAVERPTRPWRAVVGWLGLIVALLLSAVILAALY